MGAKRSQLRIIGGKWKGRKLHVADAPGLRPTPGRTRETLFNWLRPALAGSRCLDLFAGSGILGFEALSQGAAAVCLVEKHAGAVAALKRARSELACEDACRIVRQDARTYLRRAAAAGETFDVVFVDAPFDVPNLLKETVEALKTGALTLGPVYVEARNQDALASLEDDRWQLTRQTRAGDSCAGLLTTVSEAVAAPGGRR